MVKNTPIYINGAWKKGEPYVWDGSSWRKGQGWVYGNDNKWHTMPGNITAQCTFDATKFASVTAGHNDGVLTYTSESDFQTEVWNQSTSLAKATIEGDWAFDTTTGENKFGMFYCTFTSAGVRHQKLDPYNLAQYIATWDATNSKWVAGTGASSITTENTMLMIPTLYWKGESTGFTISQDSSKGTAYAHTIGGKTYKWLAIGVYCGYEQSSKLLSISGVAATANKTREYFRGIAKANTVSGGYAMQWNYYQWMLMRFLAYLSCKSFQCQGLIGQGGYSYSSVSGQCNSYGPYAGDISGTSSSSKCLIEDFWGYIQQFIDDCISYSDGMYAGQNIPDNITDAKDSTKTKIWANTDVSTSGGFPNAILTTDLAWGKGTNTSGTNAIGLCDYDYCTDYETTPYLLVVGGYSGYASVGYAGPGYVFSITLASTHTSRGSRLAFVLD